MTIVWNLISHLLLKKCSSVNQKYIFFTITKFDYGDHLVEPWALQDEEARSEQLQKDVVFYEQLQHDAGWPSEDRKQQQGVDVSIQGGSGMHMKVEEKSCRKRRQSNTHHDSSLLIKHYDRKMLKVLKVCSSHLQQIEPRRELLCRYELAPVWMKCWEAWLFQKSQRTDTWSCAASSSAWPRTCFPYHTDVRAAHPPQTAPP